MYICITETKSITSTLVRWFMSISLRRAKMKQDNISGLKAICLTFISLFGLSRYAKLKAKYNHVFIIYWSKDFNCWFSVDIKENGVILVPSYRSFSNGSKVKIIEPHFDLSVGLKKTSKHFGRGYDFLGIFGIAWSIIKYVFTGKYNSDINHSSKKFLCSEYVVDAIQESTDEIVFGEPISIHPDLLLQLTETSKYFTTVLEEDNFLINDLNRLIKSQDRR